MDSKADITLRIAPVSLEIGPKKIIQTVGYNGSVPGPVLRFSEGKTVTVNVLNETDVAKTVHWHGQQIPSGGGRIYRGRDTGSPTAWPTSLPVYGEAGGYAGEVSSDFRRIASHSD